MIYNLIRRHEGLRLHAYRCEGGVWTVGYGHTADVNAGTTVTEDEAMRLLREDVAEVRGRIEHMCAQDGVTPYRLTLSQVLPSMWARKRCDGPHCGAL